MVKFLGKYHLPKMAYEETENLISIIPMKETKSVI